MFGIVFLRWAVICTYRLPERGVEPRLNPQLGVRLVGAVCDLEHETALAVDGRPECCASRTVNCGEAYMRAFVAIGL